MSVPSVKRIGPKRRLVIERVYILSAPQETVRKLRKAEIRQGADGTVEFVVDGMVEKLSAEDSRRFSMPLWSRVFVALKSEGEIRWATAQFRSGSGNVVITGDRLCLVAVNHRAHDVLLRVDVDDSTDCDIRFHNGKVDEIDYN